MRIIKIADQSGAQILNEQEVSDPTIRPPAPAQSTQATQPIKNKPGSPTLPEEVERQWIARIQSEDPKSANMIRQWLANPQTSKTMMGLLESLGKNWQTSKAAIQRYLVDPMTQKATTPYVPYAAASSTRVIRLAADGSVPAVPAVPAAGMPSAAPVAAAKPASAPPPAAGIKSTAVPQTGQPQATTQAKPGAAKVPQGQPALPAEVLRKLMQSVNAKNASSGVVLQQWLSNANSATALMNILEVVGAQAPYYKSVIQKYILTPQQAAAAAQAAPQPVQQAIQPAPQQVG